MLFAGLTWSTGHPEDDDVWLLLLAGGCLLLAAAVSTKAAAEALEVAVPSGLSVCATGQPAAAAALATSSAATILLGCCRVQSSVNPTSYHHGLGIPTMGGVQ